LLRTLFVINPIAGGGSALKVWVRARPEIARRGVEFSEYFTESPGDATRATTKALESGVAQVVAVGGDGTLNEVVNGYLDREGQPVNSQARLALLAGGTGSDFRKSLYPAESPGRDGIDPLDRAISSIVGDRSRLTDAGLIKCYNENGARISRFFINVVSFGLGGEVSRLVNSWRGLLPGWVGGRARFMAAAIGALAHYKTRAVAVRTEGSDLTVESNLIVIANGRFAGGGMLLAPQARVDDGLFDIVVTDRASRSDVVRELPRIRRGGYVDNPKVSVLRAPAVSIGTEERIPLDIDGESGLYAPASLRVLPAAIRFAADQG